VLLGGPVGVRFDSIVTVDYTVEGATTTAGIDFTGDLDPLSGSLTFAPSEVVKLVTVAITEDTLAEGVERFTLQLSNAVNANIVDGQAVAVIGASDGHTATAPAISVANKAVGEGDLDMVFRPAHLARRSYRSATPPRTWHPPTTATTVTPRREPCSSLPARRPRPCASSSKPAPPTTLPARWKPSA
jgi:hypothetical protein